MPDEYRDSICPKPSEAVIVNVKKEKKEKLKVKKETLKVAKEGVDAAIAL